MQFFVTFILILWINISFAGYRDRSFSAFNAPHMSLDAYGNCYVTAWGLRGRCIRYNQCPSAVQGWQMRRQLPLSCYYTVYDNIVCCPEAYQLPPPLLPFTSRSVALPPPHPTRHSLRLSETECLRYYGEGNIRGASHKRIRRTLNDTEPEPVEEEEILDTRVNESEAVGGLRTRHNEYPYMCALGWRKSGKRSEIEYKCGCVLIAKRYVLTVAHCTSLEGKSPSVVLLGGIDLSARRAERIRIRSIIQHPDYNPLYVYNDIAVVKLERPSGEKPACLWANEGLPQEILTALGYGQTRFAGPSSNNLLKVFLKVLTNENCNKFYQPEGKLRNGIETGQICAGDFRGIMDTCQGDSGGPLLMNVQTPNSLVPYVVGLTSFGEGCATGTPSVYTRISYYIDWIEQIVWQ